ncbi:MAG TPA: HlyD family efflux transporter periplasmic adaptor subunit [Devosiaceae bacterium]
MKLRNIAAIVVLGAAAAAALWWAFSPRPVAVDLARIARGTLVVTVDEEGVARIRETYVISTPMAGDVQRIPLKVGDRVTRDMVVATVAPARSAFLDERSRAEAEAAVRTAEAAVVSARTDIAGAKAEQSFWQGELNRTEQLLQRGFTTQKLADQVQFELQRRNVNLATAEAMLDLRERELDQARARLLEPDALEQRSERFDVRSPASGEVLQVDNEGTRTLAAGVPLMTIGDPSNLEVVVDLLSADAVRVRTGAPASIERWGGDPVLVAQVARIEPIGFTKVSALGVEEQRVRVHLDILSAPQVWKGLGHNYRVFARIEVTKVPDALLVPNAALFRDGNNWAVLVASDGVAHLRDIVLGARDASHAEVTKGLSEGEAVILHPNDQLTEGSLVAERAGTEG